MTIKIKTQSMIEMMIKYLYPIT